MKRFRHYKKDKAILISAFGSIESMQRYEDFKNYIQDEFKDFFVYMSFSSPTILRVLKKQGIEYKNQTEAMAYLDREGYKKQIILSLNLFPTDEHNFCSKIVKGFTIFSPALIRVTRAIFTRTDDANIVLSHISKQIRSVHPNSLCLYVAHGAPYFEQAGLQSLSYAKDFLKVIDPLNFVVMLEGAYRFDFIKDSLLKELKEIAPYNNNNNKELIIIPLLLVSGSHFTHDINGMIEFFKQDFTVKVQSSFTDSTKSFYLLELPSLKKVVRKSLEDEMKKMDLL